MHDPERADERLLVQQSGGRGRGAKDREARERPAPLRVPTAPKTLDDAVYWSSWAMHAVASGQMDARTGHEIGYLVNAFKAAVEKRDLLREIETLREQLEAARAQQANRPQRIA